MRNAFLLSPCLALLAGGATAQGSGDTPCDAAIVPIMGAVTLDYDTSALACGAQHLAGKVLVADAPADRDAAYAERQRGECAFAPHLLRQAGGEVGLELPGQLPDAAGIGRFRRRPGAGHVLGEGREGAAAGDPLPVGRIEVARDDLAGPLDAFGRRPIAGFPETADEVRTAVHDDGEQRLLSRGC